MFHYANIPFNDVVWSFEQWKKEKFSDKIPFSKLPVLKTADGRYIAQSGSITRYV